MKKGKSHFTVPFGFIALNLGGVLEIVLLMSPKHTYIVPSGPITGSAFTDAC